MRVLSWLIALCGLWELGDIALPFVIGAGNVPVFVWNHIVVGLILMIAGAWAALTRAAATAKMLNRVAAAAGAWLIAASFVLGPPAAAAGKWNDIIVGVIVVVLSAACELRLRRTA